MELGSSLPSSSTAPDVAAALPSPPPEKWEQILFAQTFASTLVAIGILSAREEMYVYSSFDSNGVMPILNGICVIACGNWLLIALCRHKLRHIRTLWWAKCSLAVIQFAWCLCVCLHRPEVMVNSETQENYVDPRSNGTTPYGLTYLLSCVIAGSEVYIIGRYLATRRKHLNTCTGPSTTPLYQGSSYHQQPSSTASYSQQPNTPASWNFPVINRMTMYDSRKHHAQHQLHSRRLPPLNVYSEEFSEAIPSEYDLPLYVPESSQHW